MLEFTKVLVEVRKLRGDFPEQRKVRTRAAGAFIGCVVAGILNGVRNQCPDFCGCHSMFLTFLGLGKVIVAHLDGWAFFAGRAMVKGAPTALPLASVLVMVIDVAPWARASATTSLPNRTFCFFLGPFQAGLLHQAQRAGSSCAWDIQEALHLGCSQVQR